MTSNLSRTLRSLRAGLLLAAVVVASASARAALPFNLIQLNGMPTDLSDDGAVVVGGAGVGCGPLNWKCEPVRWARQPDGSYAMEFLDATRQLRSFGLSCAVSVDGSVVAFAARELTATVGGGSLYRWSAGQLVLLAVAPSPNAIQWPQVSGDGGRIFFASGRNWSLFGNGGPWTIETVDRSGVRSVIGAGFGYVPMLWDSSHDGAVLAGGGGLWIENAAGWVFETVQTDAALSSNGEWVAINVYDPNSYEYSWGLWNRVTRRHYDMGTGWLADFTDDLSTAVVDGALWSRGIGSLGVPVAAPGRTQLTPDGRYFLTVGAIGELAPRCGNGIDDDGDGRTDAKDPGCTSPSDTSEKEASFACDDAVDQDLDGAIDFPFDPGCASPRAQLESPQCNDGLDNDSDGKIDVLDPDCPAAWGNTESPHAPAGGCGIGPELALALPLLGWLRRRRGSSGESQLARGIPSNSTREELDHVLVD